MTPPLAYSRAGAYDANFKSGAQATSTGATVLLLPGVRVAPCSPRGARGAVAGSTAGAQPTQLHVMRIFLMEDMHIHVAPLVGGPHVLKVCTG